MDTNYYLVFIGIFLSLTAAQQITPIEPDQFDVKPIQQPVAEARTATVSGAVEYDDEDENVDVEGDVQDEMYAKEFPYGQPMKTYNVHQRVDNRSARKGRAHIRIIHKYVGKPKSYAKKYRTWTPSKEWIKPVGPRKGTNRLAQPRKPGRRRLSGPSNRKRKIKPPRGNHLRKPTPPPEPDYEYVSEEEFFPEETKKNEFGQGERRPPHKKQRRKPGFRGSAERVRPAEDYPSVSYSNFIQHPATTVSSFDYGDFLDDEPVHYPKKEKKRRRKKNKKGDRKRVRDRGEDQFGANSESVEDNLQSSDKYPPYSDDAPLRRPLRHQIQPQPTQPTPVYGEGYLGHQSNTNRLPQNVNIHGGNGESAGLGHFRNDINGQGIRNQVYDPKNYNFGSSNSNLQPDIITQQNYNQFANQGYGSTGQGSQFVTGNHPQTIANNQHYNTFNDQSGVNNFNRPTGYNQNVVNRPFVNPQTTNINTLQNAIPTNRGNEYSAKYKSHSFFDNTETYQGANQNINYNQPNNLGAIQRPSFVPSTEYKGPVDAENDFINRHLDLYSNGVKGVPVQGDGRQEFRAKDYDIGYGEVQYDESHRT